MLDVWMLVGAAVVLASIVAVRLAHRIGLPSLLAYLGLGLALGESGLGIHFDDASLANTLGLAALVLILAEGGITTNWRNVRGGVPAALSLAIFGSLISIGVVACAVHWLLGGDWRLSLLAGAVLAPTDAAAVFSVLRRLPLPRSVTGVLEAESGFNDAPTVIAVLALSTHELGDLSVPGLIAQTAYELVVGAVIGIVLGLVGVWGLRRIALPASGLYPIAVLSLTIAAYGAGNLSHASGFLAVYLSALILGNAQLPHRPATRGFAEGVAWLAQIGLFIMLGLLASPGDLPAVMVPALVAGFALVLVARPLSVFLSTIGFRLPFSHKIFISWAGLRGAVPIVLTTIPMAENVRGADRLFALVFVIVVLFTLLQGPTLPVVARMCKLTSAGDEAVELDVEAAPLEELNADLLEISIPPDSRLDGVEIFELRLPAGAQITLIVRNGRTFVPEPTTRLQAGDKLLVVATAKTRMAAERRLRAVSRRGRLAGWFGEKGLEEPGSGGGSRGESESGAGPRLLSFVTSKVARARQVIRGGTIGSRQT